MAAAVAPAAAAPVTAAAAEAELEIGLELVEPEPEPEPELEAEAELGGELDSAAALALMVEAMEGAKASAPSPYSLSRVCELGGNALCQAPVPEHPITDARILKHAHSRGGAARALGCSCCSRLACSRTTQRYSIGVDTHTHIG
jgi:hypothetical protein